MTLKESIGNWLIPKLHQISALRAIAKPLCRGWTLRQSFHGGLICLDAAEHSWAWTGKIRYETFDGEQQAALLTLSKDYDTLLDIGCNVGAMTLSVLLRNPNITAVCIDPNPRAIALLKKTLHINRLTHRACVIEAALGDRDGEIPFDGEGSVTGHISRQGKQVKCISFADFINTYSEPSGCLIKIDVEGFETTLLGQLPGLKYLRNLCFIIELHPLNFNEMGNPNLCLELLLGTGAHLENLQGQPVLCAKEDAITHIIARWPHV
jgi:FkbM family methyltransferase